MEAYYDAMKEQQRKDAVDSAKEAAKSAAIWGGLGGAANQLIYGNRSIPSILLRGLGTAAAAAPMAAGAVSLGHSLLGAPDPEDPVAYSARGALGGALGGGLLGGGLGYLMGGGRLRGLAKIPHAEKIASAAKAALPLDNLIVDHLKRLMMSPSKETAAKAAMMLGLTGAIGGGVEGLMQGSDVDEMHNIERARGY